MIIKEILEKYLKGENISENLKNMEFNEVFPEIACLKNVMQDKIYHPEGDVLTHILMMIEVLDINERNENIFWSIIYHDSGKFLTYPTFKNHEKKSVEILEKNKFKLNLKDDQIEEIKKLILHHETILKLMLNNSINEESVKKLSLEVNLKDLLKLYKCDVLGRGYKNNYLELKAIDEVEKLYNLQTKTYEL